MHICVDKNDGQTGSVVWSPGWSNTNGPEAEWVPWSYWLEQLQNRFKLFIQENISNGGTNNAYDIEKTLSENISTTFRTITGYYQIQLYINTKYIQFPDGQTVNMIDIIRYLWIHMIYSLSAFLSCHYIYSETTIDANPSQFKLRDWNHKGFIYPYNYY